MSYRPQVLAIAYGGTGQTSVGTSGQALVSNGTTSSFQSVGYAVFGDGSDGSPTFDGSTVVLGITPSANAYTLARDVFMASPTLNNGITIFPNGFRIFCSGTFTNNGTISFNGNAGNNSGTPGAGLNNSNCTINKLVTAGGQISTVGGVGGTGAGGNGGNSAQSNYGAIGGVGGAGGSAAGAAGTITVVSSVNGSLRALPWALTMVEQNGTSLNVVQGGTGGSAGGGDGTHVGGSGGSGGGLIMIAALYFAGTGNIQCLGGNGGNGGASGTNCGGGGGGGGGAIVIVSRSVVSGAVSGQTISCAGGNAGTHTGSGSDGSGGSSGTIIMIPN